VASTAFFDLEHAVAAATPTADLHDLAVADQTVKLFNAMVDFVRDPAGLPDHGINSVGRLMWRSVADMVTPAALDLSSKVSTLSFEVLGNDHELHAFLLLPRHFADLVREDLLFQVCAVVNMASQVRDFREGRIGVDDSDTIVTRGRAYEAQALLALLPVLLAHGRTVQLVGYQHELRREFPQGVKSMPPSLVYGPGLAV